ncbi:MAG TPA: PepSY-associated TM helix domain-containing protein [Bryobacteraceae bacterium]|nr:PepSY-associated TM helix domain-containing protein [Bryobacteraceae bacterium]
MPSLPDPARPRPTISLESWNRRLHYYLGLYFLFFLWLFSLTGLLLNHTQWKFGEFWPQRKETRFERAIQPTSATSDLDRAKDVMRQLNVAGEIDWPDRKQEPGRLDFNVNRPGRMHRISADFFQRSATVQQIDINSWGIMNVLHTFSGTRVHNPNAKRDWVLTTVWVVVMDALSAGLVLIVLSSYYMWYRLKQKRRFGVLALAAGILSCGFFTAGLTWLR